VVVILLSHWVAFLKNCDTLLGVPLVIGGLILMLLGWRLWKFAVVATFCLIGFAIGAVVADSAPGLAGVSSYSTFVVYGLAGAIVLGIGSFAWVKRLRRGRLGRGRFGRMGPVAVLGGLLGAGLVYQALTSSGLFGLSLWLAVAISFVVVAGLALIYLRETIVVITSLQGAALLVSGLMVFVVTMPRLYANLQGMSHYAGVFIPFVLLTPTVIGCLLQMSDARQADMGQ